MTSLEALGAWWHRKARLDARGGGRPPFRSCEGRQQSMPLAVHVSPTDWHCLCARCRIEVRVCSVSRNQGQTWERCPFQATELLGGVTQVTPATNMGVAANAVMLGSDGGFLMERQQRSRTAGMAGNTVISMSGCLPSRCTRTVGESVPSGGSSNCGHLFLGLLVSQLQCTRLALRHLQDHYYTGLPQRVQSPRLADCCCCRTRHTSETGRWT